MVWRRMRTFVALAVVVVPWLLMGLLPTPNPLLVMANEEEEVVDEPGIEPVLQQEEGDDEKMEEDNDRPNQVMADIEEPDVLGDDPTDKVIQKKAAPLELPVLKTAQQETQDEKVAATARQDRRSESLLERDDKTLGNAEDALEVFANEDTEQESVEDDQNAKPLDNEEDPEEAGDVDTEAENAEANEKGDEDKTEEEEEEDTEVEDREVNNDFEEEESGGEKEFFDQFHDTNHQDRWNPPHSSSGALKARMAGKLRTDHVDVNELTTRISRLKQERNRFGRVNRFGQENLRRRHERYQARVAELEMRQQQGRAEGATRTMESHKPFSREYIERKQKILESIAKRKGTRIANKVEQRWKQVEASGGEVKLPFRKELQKPRLAERVPIVRRAFKMLPEEELILDTTMSFVHGIFYGLYSKTNGPLSVEKKGALMDWLNLLSVTLPEEWAIHDMIETLASRIHWISSKEENLHRVIRDFKIKRKGWSASCSQNGADSGFTCGFWKILHTVSIGLAQHRGGQTLIDSGMRRPNARVFSPADAANIVKKYMEHFFLCDSCTDKFTAIYNDCSRNRRCDRLATHAELASDDDWKEMAKWLWELHNDISVSIVKENSQKFKSQTRRTTPLISTSPSLATIGALWPSMEDCLKCFGDDGSWNEDAVFLYLEMEYWPDQEDARMTRLLQFDEDYYNNGWASFSLFVVLLVVGAVLGYTLIQNRIALQKTILMVRTTATAAMAGGGRVGGSKRSE